MCFEKLLGGGERMVKFFKKNQKGITLVEILVATLITTVAIGGLLEAYRHFNTLAESTKQINTAMRDLTTMMERVRSTAFATIEINFPNGTIDGGGANDYSAIVGGYSLTNEQIVVTYPNPGANPLEIIITVQWTGPQARIYTKTLSTFRTD